MAEGSVDSLAGGVVTDLLDLIRESNVRALVYVAPVAGGFRDHPRARVAYPRVLEALREIAAKHETDRLRVVIDLPATATAGLRFDDRLHLLAAGGLPRYLADQASSLLEGP